MIFKRTKENKNWKDILNEIYIISPSFYGGGKLGIDDNHPLAIKLNISGENLMKSLLFLESHKLIEHTPNDNYILLTEKGFNVALENEKHKTDTFLQFSIGIFTIVLAVTGVYEFLHSLGMYNPIYLLWLYIITIAIILYFANKPKNKKRK